MTFIGRLYIQSSPTVHAPYRYYAGGVMTTNKTADLKLALTTLRSPISS